ncbi:MAG: hypothetical protein GQ569_13590 [Methylococcaceae bacterium]|nr:hypothetical protein [Methylococcaceae bacterium]
MKLSANLFLGLTLFSATALAENTSVYTDLTESKCRTMVLNEEEAYSEQICEGVSSFALKVLDGDDRQSITVVTPTQQEFPLNYWYVITRSFSMLGAKAEWRIHQKNPIALIVRVNAEEDAGKVSYLAVAKITWGGICVVDKIPPQPSQNEVARKSADNSANKSCLKEI